MKNMLCAITAVVLALPLMAEEAEVPYPEGYRDWYHVKSMVIEQGHPLYAAFGGIHHIYANDQALEGYQSGQFPDGAVIVFDLLEAHHEGSAVTEGARKVAGVMHKNAEWYPETGGWGFEGFGAGDPDNRVVGPDGSGACFACHAPQKDFDFVFSRLRD